MDRRFVSVTDSRFRQNLVTMSDGPEDVARLARNAYGMIVAEERVRPGFDLWRTLPVICGHGGSMWLCPSCAAKALIDQKMKDLEVQ